MSEWNLEWLNQNANRAYPFHEDMPLTDSLGVVKIPNLMITDLVFVTPATLTATYYMSRVIHTTGTLTLVFSEIGSGIIASITVDIDAHTNNQAYDLAGQGSFQDAQGRITLGDLAMLSTELPPGVYDFSSTSAALEARAVRPDIRGVRSLAIRDASGVVSEPITGAVRLTAGDNVKLTYTAATYKEEIDPETGATIEVVDTPASIRVDAISGENLTEDCGCDTTYPVPDPIRSINGVEADSAGNINLVPGSDCIDISGTSGGISISDSCTLECCGCTELEGFVSDLSTQVGGAAQLEARVDQMQTALDEFYNNVIGTLA